MKILVVKLSALGDQIHLCPAVSDIKRAYPDATIHWAVQSEFADIARLHGAVDQVHALPLQQLRRSVFSIAAWRTLFAALRGIRRTRFEYAIDAQGVLKSAAIARLSGARKIVGFSGAKVSEAGAHWFYSNTWDAPAGLSAVERNRGLIGHALGLGAAQAPDYGLTRLLQPSPDPAGAVYLAPCASTLEKRWSKNNWQALIQALDQQAGEIRLIWGSQPELSLAEEISQQSRGRATPLPSRLPVSELAARLRSAQLFVGVDSGVTHLANAVGVPTVMVFTKTFPHLFFCQGNPLTVALGGFDQPPSVQEVIDASTQILSR